MSSGTDRNESVFHSHFIVLAGMLVILLVAAALFMPPYSNSFVGDDFVQQWRIRELVASPDQALSVFKPDWTDWYYRPLQNIWILANRLLFGLQPAAYYYLQVLIHLICISLIFRTARVFGVNRWGSLAAASLFAINVEHQLTVDWISSIGIVASVGLSLSAVVVFNSYLDHSYRDQFHRSKYLWSSSHWAMVLLLVALLSLTALLFHESAILLPFILCFVWWTHPQRNGLKQNPLFWIGLIVLIILYSYIQLTRVNVNLSPTDTFNSDSSVLGIPPSLGEFVLHVGGNWLDLNAVGEGTYRSQLFLSFTGFLVIFGLILLLIKGNRAMRLGILWASAQAAFIFLFLWTARPELLGGRHLYGVWASTAIVVGGVIHELTESRGERKFRGKPGARVQWGLLLFTTVFLLYQVVHVRVSQTSTQLLTDRIMALEKQMKAIVTEVNSQTRVFSTRFTLSPAYFAPAVAVWYEVPGLSGGDLETLKKYPYATSNFYLFDTDGDRLYNLMPELQAHKKSYLLWSVEPLQVEQIVDGRRLTPSPEAITNDIIAGPESDPRLAVCIDPLNSDWISLSYESKIPTDAHLAASFLTLGEYDLEIISSTGYGQELVLIELRSQPPELDQWLDIDLDLRKIQGEFAKIMFKARPIGWDKTKSVCWSNPRLVVD